MFGRGTKLFTLFGFEVRLDMSWFFLAALIVWTLAKGLFPFYYGGLANAMYWWMGVAGALGLFTSIVIHELSHSLVARRYGMPIRGITLFIFGGVAEMQDEPPSPKAEFLMAIAGLIASVILAFVFAGIYAAGVLNGWPTPLNGVMLYLAWVNAVLAFFNSVPAFPLDGGRMLRALLWAWKKDLPKATRISSVIGSGFGLVLIALGIVSFFQGNIIGGVWWALIGMFLRGASQMSYKQLMIRRGLEGEHVRRFMKENPVSVPPSIPVRDLVDEYIFKYPYKFFPVVENEELVGCISTNDIRELPREEWERKTVRDIAATCAPANTIRPDADAVEALSRMSRTGNTRLLVVEGTQLVGIISLRDLLRFLSLKLDLDAGTAAAA